MNACLRIVLSASLASLVACVSVPAPSYQPSIDSTERLMRHRASVRVGEFDAAPGVSDARLSVRGSAMTAGGDGRYSSYLRDALATELRSAGRFDPSGATVVSGTLLRNELNGGGSRTGNARLGARFVVRRGDTVVYDRNLEAEHRWDSSFIGAIAIPTAMDNYATGVQKLLQVLFLDPDFERALVADGGTTR